MNPIEELCNTFNSRMEGVAGANAIDNAEFGVITSDYGLKLDRFPNAIPNGDFMVSKSLLKSEEIPVETSMADLHTHNVKIFCEQVRKPNDQVLVIWVGNEPVVTDVVISSKNLR